jgi:arylesterase/paraoxonase
MGTNLKRVLIVLGAALVIAALIAVRFLSATGAFRTIQYRAVAACAAEPLPGSAEDMEIDHATGIAYLSVLDRRAAVNDPLLTGTILKVDLNQLSLHPVPATADDPPGFRPQGLSLWSHANQPRRLFVVSHPLDFNGRDEQTVEVFEERTDGLFHHEKTVRDALFLHPSDLAAVGPDQFYVANDSGAHNVLTRAFELLFQLGWSDVVYYDGSHASVAASGRSLASGVMVSGDGLRLYLAESGAQQLLIFDRDTETGSLYWSGLIELPGGPANLDIAEDGSLWVAVHPNLWALMRNMSAGTPAPTMILRMAAPVTGFVKPQPIYVNSGAEFSAGSVGAAYRGRLFIGSVTERKLLVCPLPAAAS